MATITYNGYANWATWNVNLEFFDGRELSDSEKNLDTYELAGLLKEELNDYLESLEIPTMVSGWLQIAFIGDIDFEEIANFMKEAYLDSQE